MVLKVVSIHMATKVQRLQQEHPIIERQKYRKDPQKCSVLFHNIHLVHLIPELLIEFIKSLCTIPYLKFLLWGREFL